MNIIHKVMFLYVFKFVFLYIGVYTFMRFYCIYSIYKLCICMCLCVCACGLWVRGGFGVMITLCNTICLGVSVYEMISIVTPLSET